MPARFAIYYTPEENHPLAAFAGKWLGVDSDEHIEEKLRQCGFPPEKKNYITSVPRHYGFHATLKPPFILKPGTTADQLREAVRDFAQEWEAFNINCLMLSQLSGFLALVTCARSNRINHLAAQCVQHFDSFRADPAEGELERRRAETLTPRQEELLEQWGYPYVFDQYRFHMTLTDRIEDESARKKLYCALRRLVEPYCQPLPIDTVCLCQQEDIDQDFELLERYPLKSPAPHQRLSSGRAGESICP